MRSSSTLMEFGDDTKLREVVDTSEESATLQEDRLGKWGNKNLMKFIKASIMCCT